ncbi:hypothetical protein RCL1_004920 [Eukaryota sp. TZLM3-RCL]
MFFQAANSIDGILQGVTAFGNPAIAHAHIKALCQSYPSLKPEQRRFPRNGGFVIGIIITGTVPMIYQTKRYNIPVNIVLDYYVCLPHSQLIPSYAETCSCSYSN